MSFGPSSSVAVVDASVYKVCRKMVSAAMDRFDGEFISQSLFTLTKIRKMKL